MYDGSPTLFCQECSFLIFKNDFVYATNALLYYAWSILHFNKNLNISIQTIHVDNDIIFLNLFCAVDLYFSSEDNVAFSNIIIGFSSIIFRRSVLLQSLTAERN